jgi:hypothetical protein
MRELNFLVVIEVYFITPEMINIGGTKKNTGLTVDESFFGGFVVYFSECISALCYVQTCPGQDISRPRAFQDGGGRSRIIRCPQERTRI